MKHNREIEYKESPDDEFETYIDIGSCEKHYNFLSLFDPDKGKTYMEWFDDFKTFSYGEQLLHIHYYLLEYNNYKDSFEKINGEKLFNVISENYEEIAEFTFMWFDKYAPIFNGLDFEWEDIDEWIVDEIVDDNGIRKEITLHDDSIIKFKDDDDSFRSFYIPKKDFDEFGKNMEKIVDLFK